MRKLDFYEYDAEKEKENYLFSLTLENGKLIPSNEEGAVYLQNLAELYELGITTRDAVLYAEGKYDKMFDFFERKLNSPYFYVKEVTPQGSSQRDPLQESFPDACLGQKEDFITGFVKRNYQKGSPDDPEQWLAYLLSEGRFGYPPPPGWNPQPIQLDEENENWLRSLMKKRGYNPWGPVEEEETPPAEKKGERLFDLLKQVAARKKNR